MLALQRIFIELPNLFQATFFKIVKLLNVFSSNIYHGSVQSLFFTKFDCFLVDRPREHELRKKSF
jgi:hypothetical protein